MSLDSCHAQHDFYQYGEHLKVLRIHSRARDDTYAAKPREEGDLSNQDLRTGMVNESSATGDREDVEDPKERGMREDAEVPDITATVATFPLFGV